MRLARAASGLATAAAVLAHAGTAAALPPGAIVGDGIPAPLTGAPGEASRGRAIVADRTKGLCLLCHSAPIPEERFQGDLGPSLAGTGARWSAAQIRLRVADARRLNPDTIMPSYSEAASAPETEPGTRRIGAAFRGRSMLTAGEIEDVVAYLETLREP